MFTPEQRTRIRADLLERASADGRISGAAITGSVAAGLEDRWSDIDLAFGIADPAWLPDVLGDWTAYLYERHSALHHVDVSSGAWLYRVFFLRNTLQVDLAFVAATEFRPLATTFRLVFGQANEPQHAVPPQPAAIIGMAWLYALHARSAIARGRLWQAEYMVSGVRDHALALACLRHGLSTVHGRGLHLLPADVAAQFESSLVRQLEGADLARAFRVVIEGLLSEMRSVDPELAGLLQDPLIALTENLA